MAASTPRRRTRGQPTKCTPAVVKRYVAAVQQGATQEVAASHAGISARTHFSWMERGRKADAADRAMPSEAPYLHYMQAVETALREYELSMLAEVALAARGAPYETVKVVERQEILRGKVITLTTTTTETGAKRTVSAAIQMLKWRRPQEYGDHVKIDTMSPEQTGMLVARAVEGVLEELGVKTTTEVQRVVARHLELVAEAADQAAV